MSRIIDRVILLLVGSSALFLEFSAGKAVIVVLVAIALSAVQEYLDSKNISVVIFVAYCVVGAIYPQFWYLTPLMFYDLCNGRQAVGVCALVPLLINITQLSPSAVLLVLLATLTAGVMRIRTDHADELEKNFKKQRDDLTEMSISLENKVSALLTEQDNEVRIATLNERNRIAREIHDNVGHLLSSSILQLGAMMTVTKDSEVKESLSVLKDTLSKGMNSIRESVHDLRDDSVDLYLQLKSITDEFTFCPITLNYNISQTLDIKQKYAVIAIVKEALANVISHSNATAVTVSMYEHPKLFQLVISDNGTKARQTSSTTGMGLENIRQRVSSIGGNVNFLTAKGFKVFISFPNQS